MDQDKARNTHLAKLCVETSHPYSSELWSPMSSFPGLATPSVSLTAFFRPRPSLDALEKPVRFVALGNDLTSQLPRDVRHLYNRIYSITVERCQFLPSEALTSIVLAIDNPLARSWFRKRPDDERQQDIQWLKDQVDGSIVFDTLRGIQSSAHDCFALGRSEASWNAEVHSPLLRIALQRHKRVNRECMQEARVTASFAAVSFTKEVGIDLAFVLTPTRLPPNQDIEDVDEKNNKFDKFERVIRRLVLAQPADEQTINQSLYTSLGAFVSLSS